MRGVGSLTIAKGIGKQFRPTQSEWVTPVGGIVPSLEPRKKGNEESIGKRTTLADDKAADPIVAFSRPPPVSPFLGPLVALSLLDSWLKRDSNEA